MKLIVFEQQATCAPCRALKPHITAVAKELNIDLEFLEVSEHMNEVLKYNVKSTPTVFLIGDDGHKEIKSRTVMTLMEELKQYGKYL